MGMMNDKEPTMSQYTFDADIVSDLHKDAYGFRPREGFWNHWNLSTMRREAGYLGWLTPCPQGFHYRKKKPVRLSRLRSLSRRLLKTSSWVRPAAEVAVRWIVDSLDLTEHDLMYGGSYICFELGLPYRMQAEFDAILKEIA